MHQGRLGRKAEYTPRPNIHQGLTYTKAKAELINAIFKIKKSQEMNVNLSPLIRISLKQLRVQGAFINDVTQLGGKGGTYFCDTIYKFESKTTILLLQRGEKSKFV